MSRGMHLFPNGQGAKMYFFRLGVATLVRVKNGQIIEHGSYVRMVRAELLLINLQGVQIIRLRCLLASRFSENEGNIVQHRAEVRVRQIFQLGAGRNRFLVKTDRFFGLAQVIAQKGKSPRGAKKSTLVERFCFIEDRMRFEKMCLCGGAIAVLVEKLPEFFITERE